MEGALKDDRFKHILTDPRFRRIPKNVKKVKVDKRFKDMFIEKQFKGGAKLDERGRSLNLTSTENLKQLYNVTNSSEDSNDESENDTKSKKLSKKSTDEQILKKTSKADTPTSKKQSIINKGNKQRDSFSPVPEISPLEKSNLEIESLTDDDSSEEHSEEEINAQENSPSESDDSDSEETDADEGDFDHHWEELQAEAPDTDNVTNRLAVCNMDWDRIRAEDLYTVFNSFKPADSCILSVKIYPSEYGLKRMESEKLNGPAELVEKSLNPDEEEVEDKKTSKYNREKLRQYQLNRLRYYYAVVECDKPETANTLYEQLNGMEYESSSVRFDLRFIPDDVTFDQEPKSIADKNPDPTEYKPRMFVSTALQQVSVSLTWDETDPKRRETLQKAFSEPENIEKDIKEYLASSSGESEEFEDETFEGVSTQERISKYKALLQSLEESEKKNEEKYEMEITWKPGLKEKTEKMVKGKMEDSSNPFEEKLRKMKEGRKLKKEMKKAEKNVESGTDSNTEESDSESEVMSSKAKGKNTPKISDELYLLADSKLPVSNETNKKKKKKKELNHLDDFKCNVKDPRFSAIYTSHEYNIDPSDPHFKRTDGTIAIIEEKQKRLRDKEHKKKAKKFKHS